MLCAGANFAQLTSCRIRSHNQRKNRIIAQCRGEKVSFVKCTVIQTLFLTKNTAEFSNLVQTTWYSLDVNIFSAAGRCILKLYLMAFSPAVLLRLRAMRSIFMAPVTFYDSGDLETN